MRLKRIISTALTLLYVFPLLTVSAHPGRTDTQGGHTDTDTGDYHYHHGWPAHYHYDMNDDGIIDCPYEFIDAEDDNYSQPTDQSSSSSWASGSDGRSHITIDRLKRTYLTPPITEPSDSSADIIITKGTLWDKLCNYIGDDGTAWLIVISTFIFLISAPLFYLSDKYHWTKVSQIIAPFAFLSALIPGFIAICIFCALYIIYGFLVLLWLLISSVCKWLKSFFHSTSDNPNDIASVHLNNIEVSINRSVEFKSQSTVTSSPQTFQHQSLLTPNVCISSPTEKSCRTISPTNSRSNQTEMVSLPPQTFSKPDPDVDFRLVLMPETEVSAHTRCRDTCRYLWYETLMLRNSTTPPISSDACVYLWTALFYTAVKTLRNQASVDRIYSYFAEITAEFVTEDRYTTLVITKVRDTYRSLRQPLNDSGIDPRSGNGRLALWNFLISSNPELLQHSDIRKGFLEATERVWKMIGDVFPQSHPYPKSGEVQYSLDEFPKD